MGNREVKIRAKLWAYSIIYLGSGRGDEAENLIIQTMTDYAEKQIAKLGFDVNKIPAEWESFKAKPLKAMRLLQGGE